MITMKHILNPLLIPVSKTETVTLSNGETLNLTTLSGRDWDINSWGNVLSSFRGGRFFLFLSGKDSDLFTINDLGVISFKDSEFDISGLTDANNDYALTVTIG